MVEQFKEKDWSFLEVSKKYILGDVKAQYQIIVKYFKTLRGAFPIDPLKKTNTTRNSLFYLENDTITSLKQ